MKAILSRLALRKEIGLAIGERELAVSEVATTPIGRVEVVRDRMPYEPGGLAAAVERLLTLRFTKGELAKARVTVGLPATRVFFATRPIRAENREASPEVLLHEVLQSPMLNVDDMAVDLIRFKVGQRPLASIVSCRRRFLSSLLTTLEACGARPVRIEPSPFALLRDAARRHRPPKKARSYIRAFLGDGQGLAVLIAAPDLPLLWREFDLRPGDEAASVRAAASVLAVLGASSGLEGEPEAVLIHGRPDLGPLAEVADGPATAAMRVGRHDGPPLDDVSAAVGLAEAPGPGVEAFNLARSMGRSATFLEAFPWGVASLVAAVLVAATLVLNHRRDDARAAARVAGLEDERFKWAAKLAPEGLEAERKALSLEVDSVRKFLDSRVAWTAFSRGVIGRLDPEMALASFQGEGELDSGKGKAKKSLGLRLRATLPKSGAMPREIDGFLVALRDDPLLKRDFPDIKLSDLRPGAAAKGAPVATFTVNCLPMSRPEPPKPLAKKGAR